MSEAAGTTSEMKIGALAPWFGGKRTLAPRIVAELGPHKFYVEPFCGSLAVLLAKKRAAMESVNDLHGDLINLARVLASDRAVDLYERVSRMLMHESVHAECNARCCDTPCEPASSIETVEERHVSRAGAYMAMSWMGRNGSAGTSAGNITMARRFTHNGGSGGLRWQSAVDSIPAWHQRLRGVSISNMNAFKLLERLADQDGTTIYLDPPYLRKSDKYIHDLKDEDHKRLRDSLARFQNARVILSYYDEPELREWYAGWTWVECPITKGLVNQGMRDEEGAVEAPEVLIINGPSLTQGGLFTELPTTRRVATEGVLPGEPRENPGVEQSTNRASARNAKRGLLCNSTASSDAVPMREGVADDAPSFCGGNSMSAMFRIEMLGHGLYDRSDRARGRGAEGGRTVVVVHLVNHFPLPYGSARWAIATARSDPYVAIYRALKKLRLFWKRVQDEERAERGKRFGPLFG